MLRVVLECFGFQTCRGRLVVRAAAPVARAMGTARFRLRAGARRAVRVTLRHRTASLRATCGAARTFVTTASTFPPGPPAVAQTRHRLGTPARPPASCRA